jgi:hypothetical protein
VVSRTDDEAVDRARARVDAFEDLIRRAIEENYHRNFDARFAAHLIPNDPVLAWDLRDLTDRYTSAGAYPAERLAGVLDRAIDLKLQYHFVMTTLGIHNTVISQDFHIASPLDTPRDHLMHLSVMQSLIGQVRVLWERLMTLVYYLETGGDPRGKSVRRVFFGALGGWGERWTVLREWEPVVDDYDAEFRTPEYHNRSRMRRELFGGPVTDPNEIMALITPVMNGFWPVLCANVAGARRSVVRLGHNVSSGLPDDP